MELFDRVEQPPPRVRLPPDPHLRLSFGSMTHEHSPEERQRFAREVLERMEREAREWIENDDRRIRERQEARLARQQTEQPTKAETVTNVTPTKKRAAKKSGKK